MEDATVKTIKKTVVVHPIMDQYVRKTWAILIEEGYDASYSMALNFMLLTAIQEGIKEGGLAEETTDVLGGFLGDQATISQLNLQDNLSQLKEIWGLNR